MISFIFRWALCLGLALGISDNLMAQKLSGANMPPKSDDMPSWAALLYKKPLNARVLEAAYEDYYKTHKFEKSIYTLFYRRLVKENKQNIQEDGTILEEQSTPTEVSNRERTTTNRTAGWSVIGPLETYAMVYDEPTQPKKAWQVNLYAFDVAESNPSILYAGASTGGIYKTTDKGLNWVSVSDNYDLGTITAIAVHPTDPLTVYAGTSTNIYKTTNGGTTWNTIYTLSGLGTNDLAIVPSSPNTIFHGGDKGLRRSTDGGATWTQIPNVTKIVYDIEINSVNNNSVYILHQNTSTTLTEFWYSSNGGSTFGAKTSGWTTGTGESARMTITPADTNRIYAVILMATPTAAPAIMRSTDGGKTWTKTVQSTVTGLTGNATTPLGMSNGQGYYDLSIMASSTNANEVIVATSTAYKSTDGGLNFTALGGYNGDFSLHPDIQEMKMVGNDAWISTDGGLNLSSDFYTSITNHSVRINGIYGSPYWGFGQGWNEDILCGGRYHNGNAVMYETYPAGKALRLGGGEAATGYVMYGRDRYVAHSDIDGDIVPPTFTSPEWSSFSFTKYPNEDGYGDDASEVEFSPTCFNHIYSGQGTALWKSTDGGTTFTQVYNFNSSVRKYEISRSNPNVMYLATDLNLWKTTNGGSSWTALTIPASLITRMSITLSFTDENTLWITAPNAPANNRVFMSTNGGSSWTNLTTTTINGQGYYNIVHQAGTNGGVYIIAQTGAKVFYKNNTLSDWVDFSTNLPKGFNITALKPFYKKSKLRAAGNRGIWEADFYEPSVPIAQPTVSQVSAVCLRDTFYFDDFSALNHTGATWNWTFTPTPQYVSSTTVRNPKVVFGTLGSCSVSLTVTNANGTSTKSISNMASVTTDYCAAQTSPTTMADFTGAANSNFRTVIEAPNFGATQDFSVSFWFKTGTTSSDAAMVTDKNWDSGSYNGWVFSMSSGKVWFNIGDGEGHRIDLKSVAGFNDNVWHHAAASVTRTGNAVLYVDGVNVASTSAAAILTIQSGYPLSIGMDPNGSWVYSGQLDELKIWKTALTQDQIRESMHLTTTSAEPNLLHYYQFNDATGTEYDRAGGGKNLTMGTAASRVNSHAPVGSGNAFRMTVNSSGTKDFTGTNCQIIFPASGTYPNGELVVTAINTAPDQNPSVGTPLSKYWVVRNYGTNASFSALTSISFSNLGVFGANTASNYRLFKRTSNANGATWGTSIDNGDVASSINNFTVTFSTGNNITSFSQFALTSVAVIPVELLSFNAVLKNKQVALDWTVLNEKDMDNYIIERSTDGKTFSSIGTAQAKGNSSIPRTIYNVQDAPHQYNTYYYRLKMVEKGGSYHYSNIQSVVFDNNKPLSLNIFPNPTNNVLNIQFQSDKAQTVDFELFDLMGKRVYNYTLSAKEGDNWLYFHTHSFAAGLYSLRITQGRLVSVEKIVIK